MPVASHWQYLAARTITAALVVLVVIQAALAGNFLGGHYDALMLHSLGARATEILALLQLVALVLLRRAGGSWSLVAMAGLIMVVVMVQSATGLFRLTGLHVPLGVLLILGIVQVTLCVWRLPLPGRANSERQDAAL
ncbi:hypothetical protein [Mycobacterium sp. DBP42]|uniref:hypothetical protein n=1 Tax=Mycobacterium sp. DBP42 TaxID=2545267 RepID=UPI00110CDCCB|nr:hypothetical protein [Mycobacterium sp. DBP42]TMS51158.1 hypothetical protein E0T84_20730 [Mycobacterium sp. DBP42]